MMHSRRTWLAALAFSFGLMAGCERVKQPEAVISSQKVIMLSARGERMFEIGQRNLLARLMSQDANYQLQVLDAGFDPDAQLSQLKTAVEERPLAILVDALDGNLLKPQVEEAVSAGILVIGLGESSADLGCSTVLLADQKKIGELAGGLVVKALFLKSLEESSGNEAIGRVVEIRGDDESRHCQRRHEGFVEALKTAPGVILVHDAPGDWSFAGGRDRTHDAVRLQRTFDVIYAHNDTMALGAAMALVQFETRDKVMVIGTDGFRGQEGGMTLVGDGEIDATIYQPLLVDFAWVMIRQRVKEPSFRPKAIYEMPLRTIQPRDLSEIRLKGLPAYPEL